MRDRPILIAGAGIGGLAGALGLAQKGFDRPREVFTARGDRSGHPTAAECISLFDYLGVGDAARVMAVFINQRRLMDAITFVSIPPR